MWQDGLAGAGVLPDVQPRAPDRYPYARRLFAAGAQAHPQTLRRPLGEAELDADGSFNSADVLKRQGCQFGFEPLLADGSNLVGHRLARFAIQIDWGFTRVNAGHVAGNRNDLYAVQVAVGCVIADDDGGTSVLDFTAKGGIEIDPPDFTAKHEVL